MARINVHFDDERSFFYPGEKMRGDVVVKVDRIITCSKITAELEKTSVEKQVMCFRRNKNTERVGEVLTLLERESSSEDLTLEPTVLNYPFEFQLPAQLAPSVKARGYVRYQIKVKIVVLGLVSKNIIKKNPFKIFAPSVNLNETSSLKEEANASKETSLRFLCLEAGPMQLRVKIPKKVYFLGEQLPFSCELDNVNVVNGSVKKVEAKLMATYTYLKLNRAGKLDKDKQMVSSTIVCQRIRERDVHQLHGEINVPDEITPSFENSSSINLEYHFIISVSVSFAFAADISIPVIISSRIERRKLSWIKIPETGGGESSESYFTPEQGSPVELLQSEWPEPIQSESGSGIEPGQE